MIEACVDILLIAHSSCWFVDVEWVFITYGYVVPFQVTKRNEVRPCCDLLFVDQWIRMFACLCISIGPVLRINSTQDRAAKSMAQQRLESASLCLQVARRCIKTLRWVNSTVTISSLPPAVENASQTEWSFRTPTERICVLIHNHNVHYAPDDHCKDHVLHSLLFIVYSSFFCGGKTKRRCRSLTEQYRPTAYRVRTTQYLASRSNGKLVHQPTKLSMSYNRSCTNRKVPSAGHIRHHRIAVVNERLP